MGFAESFSHGPIWQVRADDFGIPQPAAIAFGLAGAWPASLLLRLGLPTADAYTTMVAWWLAVSYWGAYRLGRILGGSHRIAVLGGVSWLTMPVVWAHAHYSQLALGIALLPLYLVPALSMSAAACASRRGRFATTAAVTALIAVFMDGYTFMMLACASTVLLVGTALTQRRRRSDILRFALPVQLTALASAYALYSAYIGDSGFEAHSLDAFRAYSLDPTYIWFPQRGMAWWSDITGLSINHDATQLYGDASVWTTTFAAPTVIAGVAAWWWGRTTSHLHLLLLLVAMGSFYLALGPSLKLAATRPADAPYYRMPANEARLPTGTGFVSEHLPGFDVMRASYRWLALCLLALWLLVLLRSIHSTGRSRRLWTAVLAAIAVLNVPDLPRKLDHARVDRSGIARLDETIIPELKRSVSGQRVLFAPWGNDFLANYLAPRAGFQAFNIGGDKNLTIAQSHWPSLVFAIGRDLADVRAGAIQRLLGSGTADAVILPYFSLPAAARGWPCGLRQALWVPDLSHEKLAETSCLVSNRRHLRPLLETLQDREALTVSEMSYFAVVRSRTTAVGGVQP